jgi:hypothetical protein
LCFAFQLDQISSTLLKQGSHSCTHSCSHSCSHFLNLFLLLARPDRLIARIRTD